MGGCGGAEGGFSNHTWGKVVRVERYAVGWLLLWRRVTHTGTGQGGFATHYTDTLLLTQPACLH